MDDFQHDLKGKSSVVSSLRRRIRALLVEAIRRRGYSLVPRDLPWVDDRFAYHAIHAIHADTVLDLGANTGQFAHNLRAAGFDGRIISFEPQAAAFAELSRAAKVDPAWDCYRLALGSTPGHLTMHVSAFSPSSSLLPIGQRHVELFPFTLETGTEEVEVVRLDDWIASRAEPMGKLFLKIDTQGYESHVLAGGAQTLTAAVGALVELNFADLFDGQSKYYEVMRTLELSGLRLFTLLEVALAPEHRGYLWGDGLFLKADAASTLAGTL